MCVDGMTDLVRVRGSACVDCLCRICVGLERIALLFRSRLSRALMREHGAGLVRTLSGTRLMSPYFLLAILSLFTLLFLPAPVIRSWAVRHSPTRSLLGLLIVLSSPPSRPGSRRAVSHMSRRYPQAKHLSLEETPSHNEFSSFSVFFLFMSRVTAVLTRDSILNVVLPLYPCVLPGQNRCAFQCRFVPPLLLCQC